jgi:hypothetical protein
MATNNSINNVDLPIAGGTMTGALILNADPATALGAVTKQYADAIAAGIDFKDAAVAATTTALTVTYSNGVSGIGATLTNAGAQAAFSIDGISPAAAARVLIKNQASAFQNGIYVVTVVGTGATNWVLTRSTDYDQAPSEIFPGTLVPVTTGTANALTSWLQTATVATIGTDAINFSEFSSAPLTLPLAVTQGGTGVATLTTAYGVLCAGTTATGTVQTLSALGASTTVLTSNGAGALPSFQAAGGGGNWVKIAAATASASATVSFSNNLSATYNNYCVLFENVINATDAQSFLLRYGTGGTPTYQTSSYVGVTATTNGIDASTYSAASTISFKNATANATIGGHVFVHNVNNANYKCTSSVLVGMGSGPIPTSGGFSGWWGGATTVLTSLRFLFASGNITSGDFTLYGLTP